MSKGAYLGTAAFERELMGLLSSTAQELVLSHTLELVKDERSLECG